jgi:DNA polymerase
MIIAQAPGEHEDLEERHFIGPSGRVFDQLLSNARVSRNELFLTNLLKCRLPKNRRPRQREIKACLPFLQEEVAIVDPEILVSLGFYATRSVLYLNNIQFPQAKSDSAQFFGRLFWQGQKKVYPLPHPASLLYSPSFKTAAEQQSTLLASRGDKNGKITIWNHVTLPYPLPPAWKTGGREGNQRKKGFVPIPDNTYMTQHKENIHDSGN